MEKRIEYNADEFLGFEDNGTFADEVDKKISFLYDACMLHKRACKRSAWLPDEREEMVRKMLSQYNSSILMDNAVRGILMGDYTLNELLKRKGYLQ